MIVKMHFKFMSVFSLLSIKKSENRFYQKSDFSTFLLPNLVWKPISIGHGSANAIPSKI